jgi:hypothetical protein
VRRTLIYGPGSKMDNLHFAFLERALYWSRTTNHLKMGEDDMKILGTLLLTLTILASNVALAYHHIGRTCVAAATAAGQMPLSYIAAEEVIDEDTGLTSALLVSTTYSELKFCKAGLKGKMNTPVRPLHMNDVSESSKCYKNVKMNLMA